MNLLLSISVTRFISDGCVILIPVVADRPGMSGLVERSLHRESTTTRSCIGGQHFNMSITANEVLEDLDGASGLMDAAEFVEVEGLVLSSREKEKAVVWLDVTLFP